MSGENLIALGPALSQMLGDTLYPQWNRSAQFLNLINSFGGVSAGAGKNVSFPVQFTGTTAQTVADGSDVPSTEYNQDNNVPATFQWANYRSSFQVSETEVDAAIGSEATPDKLRQIFADRVEGSAAQIASAIEKDLLTGTGMDASGNPTIIGIYNALVSSGVYAGINTATYSEWASNILANGGVARALTSDLLEQADANVFNASNEDWGMLISTANVTRKYAQIFGPSSTGTPLQRINDQNAYNVGMPNDGGMQQANLSFKGKPVYRNRLNPTGKMALVNPRWIKVKYLPMSPVPQDSVYSRMMAAEGGNGMTLKQSTGVMLHIKSLAKTGDSYKFSMKATLAMCITRPNAFALLQDISEQ